MPKPNIFLDYGGLIFNYDFNTRTLFRAHNLAREHLDKKGFNLDLDAISSAHDKAIKAYLEARRDGTEWHMDKIMGLMLRNLGIHSPDLVSRMSTLYKLNDHDSAPKGNAKEILTDLAQDRRLGIISNLPHDALVHELKRYGMRDLFDTVTVSYQVGVRKPHPAIYLEAMRRAKVKPSDSVFVSHEDTEVKGAEAVGMEGVLTDSLEEMVGVK